ncbi:hypothetical protein L3Y34_004473 [Caenorhabditis briggsae]|uniref:Uncharacterized protein n=1 Tax=Caenorhabditis briggsae TaxID=6238 RepID=A0AAE9ABZ0_CAEBR|nr:hypothetical protein L3Y34_004473 [Caenorhabditis briggsae]
MSAPAVPYTPPVPGIHGNESYINFEFSFFTLPMFLLTLPLLYVPITIIIILRIFVKLLYGMRDKNVNVPLFSAISIAYFVSILFFILDFVFVRLFTAGVFTSWCASVEPNHYLIVLYTATYYVNYASMVFPFLVSTMRLILIAYPQNQMKINRTLLRIAIPMIFIYPIFSTFFMFPAVGYCSQARGPFPFGSVLVGFQNSLFGLKNNYFLVANNMLWMAASLINNSILLIKLARLKSSFCHNGRSKKSYKAEVSLTFTTFSMIFSYVSSSLVVISYQLGGDSTYYVIMFRPFGNDLDMCICPWVFYLTHPIFRRKTNNVIHVNQNEKLQS